MCEAVWVAQGYIRRSKVEKKKSNIARVAHNFLPCASQLRKPERESIRLNHLCHRLFVFRGSGVKKELE